MEVLREPPALETLHPCAGVWRDEPVGSYCRCKDILCVPNTHPTGSCNESVLVNKAPEDPILGRSNIRLSLSIGSGATPKVLGAF
jgi:hypothetical protein